MTETEDNDSTAPAFIPPTPEELSAMLPSYHVERLIALGGMGAVYAGLQTDLDRPVAIKILPPEAMKDAESIDRFRSEAKAMARLTHPHIPAVYDFAVIDSCCVLVMELVEGENVYALLQAGKIQPPLALRIFSEVCDAVHFAHSRGVIHGDIKPGNIILADDGRAKLADFGLARLMASDSTADSAWAPMGTPEYAAPELYEKSSVPDHRADIYSLGVVLQELLTGETPSGDFELPAEALQLDPRVDEIISRCMEQRPEDRWDNAAELRQLARDIIDGRNVPAPEIKKAATRKIVIPGRRAPIIAPGKRAKPAAATAALPVKKAPVPAALPAAIRSTGEKTASGPAQRPASHTGWYIGAGIAAAAGLLIWSALSPSSDSPSKEKEPIPEPVTSPEKITPPVVVVAPPEPVVQAPPPAPDPPVAPAPPSEKPVVREKPMPVVISPADAALRSLRDVYRSKWKEGPGVKYGAEKSRIGTLYNGALAKLEAKLLDKGDAVNVLAVRKEKERFASTSAPVPKSAISALESLASLQNALNIQLEKMEAGLAPDVLALRESYLLEIRKTGEKASEDGDDLGTKLSNAEFDRVNTAKLNEWFNAPTPTQIVP